MLQVKVSPKLTWIQGNTLCWGDHALVHVTMGELDGVEYCELKDVVFKDELIKAGGHIWMSDGEDEPLRLCFNGNIYNFIRDLYIQVLWLGEYEAQVM